MLQGIANAGIYKCISARMQEAEEAKAGSKAASATIAEELGGDKCLSQATHWLALSKSFLFRHTPDLLFVVFVALLADTSIEGEGFTDLFLAYYVMPAMISVMLVLSALQKPGEGSLLKTYIFEASFWVAIGDVNFYIYILFDQLGRYWYRMALQRWYVPPGTMFSTPFPHFGA